MSGSSNSNRSTTFTVDSQLLLELGERLVPRRSIALAELVKNAYDADATSCTITLEQVAKPGGTITVQDTGLGINPQSFRNTWMRIATTDSLVRPYSKRYHRPRTGAKGVGRFACRVLSNRLVLDSVSEIKSGIKQRIVASFDWGKFSPGSNVTEIPVSFDVTKVDANTRTGTKIILQNTREPWTAKDIDELRRDAFTLVSPFPVSRSAEAGKDPGFEITLKAPEFRKEERNLREDLLRVALATLKGEVNVPGQPMYSLKFRGETQTFPYSPKVVFDQMGPAEFTVHFFIYDKANFGGVDISLTDARELGRRQGGVRVYMDGFRIFKYGDPSDDWLGLDADRAGRKTGFELMDEELTKGLSRPALLLPGNNQLFGVVRISRFQNPNLLPTVTRDRLFENDAFSQLRRFVRYGIDWMTVEYARYRRRKNPTQEVTKQDITQARETVQENISILKESARDTATQQVVAKLDEAVQKTFTALEESISKISMIEVLASTGTMVFVFEHELDLLVSSLRELSGQLQEASTKAVVDKEQLGQISNHLEALANNLNELGLHIGLLTGVESRTRRQPIAIKQAVDDLIRPFGSHLDRFGIGFDNQVTASLRTPRMFLCEFDSILLNLLSNSIKAVKSSITRKIMIRANKVENALEIEFLDTGPGIPADKMEEVFEPFTTFSIPDPVFGQGTGLGLTIVRDIVTTYAGQVSFIVPPSGWGSCARIIFPTEEEEI